MPKQSQFRAESKEVIEWRLQNEFPANVKVRAEKVTEGGLFGMFSKQYYEVFVEIPDEVPPPGVGGQPAPAAVGVAALLMEADMAEARLRKHSNPTPKVSTNTPEFDELMSGIAASVREVEPAVAPIPHRDVPELLKGAGEVVLVVGVGHDALTAARVLATAAGSAEIRTAGSAMMGGFVHLVGRQGLEEAKSAGHRTGRVVIVAFGISQDGSVRIPALSELPADQVWLTVDATRKASDTEAWVKKVTWVTAPDALYVLGAENTLSPQTVNELEVPVGWVDGHRALSPSMS